MEFYNKVLQQLNNIRDTKGAKEKAKLLKEYLELKDNFRVVVCWMLNPFLTFGINKFFPQEALEGHVIIEEVFHGVFCDLMSRKLAGGAAQCALADLTLHGVPAELIQRIINKDPGAGFGAATVNKIVPNLIPEFSYMRCSRPSQVVKKPLPYETGVFSDKKSDGMFVNLAVEMDFVGMTTRQGNPLPLEKFPLIALVAKTMMKDTQTHGELTVYRDGKVLPREIGNGLINHVIEGGNFDWGDKLCLEVWDQIPLACAVKKGKYKVPYRTRRASLMEQVGVEKGPIFFIDSQVVYSKKEAKERFKKILQEGGEGTVDKDPEMFWEDGTSKGQVKNKAEIECDLKIVGYRPGKGKNADTFGSVLGQSSCGQLEVAISGMSDDLRKYIHTHREELLGTIIFTKYNVITEPSPSNDKYSLFLPRISELRKDKTLADSLEQIKQGFIDAIEAM